MSVRILTRLALGAALLLGSAGVSCTGSDGDAGGSTRDETPWAQEAVDLFDSVAQDLTDADRHAAATYFSDGGVLDLRAWRGEVNAGRLQIAEALGKILFIEPRANREYVDGYPDLQVHVDQLFLGAHEAVARFDAQWISGAMPWMQLYSMSADAVASSRLYTEDLGHVAPFERWTYEPEHPVYDRYVDVWSSGDLNRLAEVYAHSIVVRDALRGTVRVGFAELAAELRSGRPVEPGPWPEHFRYDVGGRHEKIAVFQLGGSCPALEARRWVIVDGLIVDETRYVHVDSVRRCSGSAGDGWWTDFEVADMAESAEFTVDQLEIGGHSIEVVNAEPKQLDLIRWLFGQFDEGSLAQPDVAAFWFPPSVDCGLSEAIAQPEDERFDRRHTVTLCFTPDELSAGWPGGGWSPHVAHQGLHELAHVWMYDHLGDRARSAFLERTGLDTWRDAGVFWPERGVELAAETIAWGLAGPGDAAYLVKPAPDCEELAARYVLLTGRDPLTTCDELEIG